MSASAVAAVRPPLASMHLILEAPGVRMWYRAELGPGASVERHSVDECAADPLSLAILEAALDGAREAYRGIAVALQLHLPGVDVEGSAGPDQ